MKYLSYDNKPDIYPPCLVLTHCPLVIINVPHFKILCFPVFLIIFLHLLHQLHSLKPFWFGWIFLQLLLLATALGPSSFSHSYLILMSAVSIQPKNMLLLLLSGFPDEEEFLTLLLQVRYSNLNEKIQLNGGRKVLWQMVWHCPGNYVCLNRDGKGVGTKPVCGPNNVF